MAVLLISKALFIQKKLLFIIVNPIEFKISNQGIKNAENARAEQQ